MAAAQAAIDAVTASHLGVDVEIVLAQLTEQLSAGGVQVPDEGWLRTNCAEPIADGQPVIVVADVDVWGS